MSANGFNFLAQTPGQGVYQVQLEIALAATAASDSIAPGANATVAVGAGSLVEILAYCGPQLAGAVPFTEPPEQSLIASNGVWV
jgi:hypothetical protein